MRTIKLFQKDPYLKNCTSEITEISEDAKGFLLVLDKTVFFPTGGGQSCDKGTINGVKVLDVFEKNGTVFHLIENTSGDNVFRPGDSVSCEIDWDHRFTNMQRHCGEHILSGIFFREYGGVNRGFHMGENYMTIDISLEENPDITTLTWDMAMKAERLANEVIWSDAPVITRYYDTREEAANLPLRKKLTIEKDISIVCVGDVRNPSDCVACCGTHPKTAGQVGVIKILRLENYKGMFRIYCEAGQKALSIFDDYHETLTEIGNRYSAAPETVKEKLAVHEEKTKLLRDELYRLKTALISSHTGKISAALQNIRETGSAGFSSSEASETELKYSGSSILVKEYDDLSVDDLLKIGRNLELDCIKLLLIVSRREKTVLLFSNGATECGKIVKETASIYQGKGGGNKNNARAIFPKDEYIDTFIDLLEKHLR